MYLEYQELLKKYKDAARRYNEALEMKSKLILSVMPGSTKAKEVACYDNTTTPDTKIINYTFKIDEVDSLINQSRNTRDMLNYELKKMALEMKNSTNAKDRIYYYKWIRRLSPYKFYRIIGYSIRQTYNIINEIKKELYRK